MIVMRPKHTLRVIAAPRDGQYSKAWLGSSWARQIVETIARGWI